MYVRGANALTFRATRPGCAFPYGNGVYCFSTAYPPPCRLQNLETKRLKFRLCARSLSLQGLQAKSREHWSYGPSKRQLAAHFGTGSSAFGAGPEATHRLSQIVKDRRYLVDNVSCNRLSDSKQAVNHKGRCAAMALIDRGFERYRLITEVTRQTLVAERLLR
jgi:hypothetical protein